MLGTYTKFGANSFGTQLRTRRQVENNTYPRTISSKLDDNIYFLPICRTDNNLNSEICLRVVHNKYFSKRITMKFMRLNYVGFGSTKPC